MRRRRLVPDDSSAGPSPPCPPSLILSPSPRLFYTLELAIDVLQPVSACSLLHRLYPPAAGTGPLRSLAAVLLGNGVLALALRAKTSPLPVR